MASNYFFCAIIFLISPLLSQAGESPESPTSPAPVTQNNVENDRVGVLNTEAFSQLALSEEVKANQLVWLEVTYTGENTPRKILALAQKPRAPVVQGAVLLLHDKEQHADWPYLIHPLRQYLPDSGWFTLSVNLPYDTVKEIPKRSLETKKADDLILNDALRKQLQRNSSGTKNRDEKPVNKGQANNGETSAEAAKPLSPTENKAEAPVDINLVEQKGTKTTLSYSERAEFHIAAAIDYIHQQGYQNIIIITYGSAANLALNHVKGIASQIPAKGFALVMIDPVLQPAYQEDLSLALGKGFKAPVLDIVNTSNIENKALALERAAGARMAQAEKYMQLALVTDEGSTQALIRRIRFWIERYAPGMAATKVQGSL